MTENINKNISVWRGDTTPPTNYHIWIKSNGTQYEYVNGSWKTYNELIPVADSVHNGLLSNTDKTTIGNLTHLNVLAKQSSESLATINYNSDTVEVETELRNLKTLALTKKSIEINSATQETAGVLSASDKKKIDTGTMSESDWAKLNNTVPLDENGLISSQYLPSYVDDVLEYDTIAQFPKTGESGKIYVDISAKLTYRWTGSQYTEISKSLALGTTSTTAYAGDQGVADRYDIDNIIANGMIPFAGFVSINASEMESGETTSSYKSVSGIGYGVYFNTKINKFVYKNNNKYYPLWTNCKYWGYTESSTSPVNVIPYSNQLYRLSGSDSAGDPLINVYKFSAYNNQLKQLTTYERSLIQTNTNNISKNASDIVTLGDKINTVRQEVTDDTKEILEINYININPANITIKDTLNSEYFKVYTNASMNYALLAQETDSSGNLINEDTYYIHWSNCERWGSYSESDGVRYPKQDRIYNLILESGEQKLCIYRNNILFPILSGILDTDYNAIITNISGPNLDSTKGTLTYSYIQSGDSDKVASYNIEIPSATKSTAGLMSASDKSTLTSLSNTSQNTVDDVSKIKYNVNSTSLINVNAFCGVSMPYLSLTGILSDLESKCYDYNLTINNPGQIITYLYRPVLIYVMTDKDSMVTCYSLTDWKQVNTGNYFKFYGTEGDESTVVEGKFITSTNTSVIGTVSDETKVEFKTNSYGYKTGTVIGINTDQYDPIWKTMQFIGESDDEFEDESNWKEVNYSTKESNEATIADLQKQIETLQAGLISLGWSSEE